jgi:predicted nuclease of predicted toxin-antitoxin system
MKFLVDNQLPPLLSKYLQQHGHDSAHVADLALDEADDLDLWEYCIREGSILISKDEDFVFLAWRPGDIGRLLWVRLGNCRNPALIDAFNVKYDGLITAFESGLRIVELR